MPNASLRSVIVDTAGEYLHVVLACGTTIVAEHRSVEAMVHSRNLHSVLQDLCARAEWSLDSVDVWAVSNGPGSFTGIRIGLSAIKALAFVYQKPCLGLSALDVLAYPWLNAPCDQHLLGQKLKEGLPVWAMIDARREAVYAQRYQILDQRVISQDPQYYSLLELIDQTHTPHVFVGSGAERYQEILAQHLGTNYCRPEFKTDICSSGQALVNLAMEAYRDPAAHQPRPLYVLPSQPER